MHFWQALVEQTADIYLVLLFKNMAGASSMRAGRLFQNGYLFYEWTIKTTRWPVIISLQRHFRQALVDQTADIYFASDNINLAGANSMRAGRLFRNGYLLCECVVKTTR